MKRSAEMIIKEIGPLSTGKRYEDRWQEFIQHQNLNEDTPPKEDHFVEYFDYLRNTKKYASSTLWSIYSMLNNKVQLNFGFKLQKFPRITLLLKSYEAGYTRKKAKEFSKEEVMKFLREAPDEGENIHLKVAVVLAYFGGLRCAELVSLTLDDFEFNQVTGMWVTYKVSKQKGESISNKFNIPLQYCTYLQKYDEILDNAKLGNGRVFKTYRVRQDGSGYYVNQPMGKHVLAKVPMKMALYLQLSDPKDYTGHSFRRTAANVLAEGGASSSVMKKHFNWQSENTSMKYIENTQKSKIFVSSVMLKDDTSNTNVEQDHQKAENVINFSNCQNVVLNFK